MTKDEALRLAREALVASIYCLKRYNYPAMERTIEIDVRALAAIDASLDTQDPTPEATSNP